MRAFRRVSVVFLMAAVLLLSAAASAEGEFRPLPIDLSGGAPLTEEYASDLLVYEDPTIRVERTLRTENKLIGREYYAVDIVIKDPSQIRTASAEPTTFITERRKEASVIAKRVNAVFAMNGDYCGDFHGNESFKYVLRQGTVFRDTVDKRLDMLLIDEDGDLHILQGSPDLETMDKTQINGKKVVNALQFGPALVIDGIPTEDDYLMSDAHSPQFADADGRCDRLCILQMGPLHYMAIATRNGATMAQFKQLVLDVAPDCLNAYVLDGGGSTQLVFLGTRYNNVNKSNQNNRKLSDIIYFASAWFADE
ncbi:MAG: phosphodiester glycosidase family protein [Clostridia bacterium]|nr:phosphodiester glycosidase family protein [Clostridia bacterium]